MSDNHDNAFEERFLRLLDEAEEAGAVEESELAGPWKVVRCEAGYALYEAWQDPRSASPYGTFEDRATALRFAAALSAASREPLYRLDRSPTPGGRFPVLSAGGRVEGTLACYHERVLELAHMADYCARSPVALAAVLEAAGATTLRKAGLLLQRALEEMEMDQSSSAAPR
jgi:hypothetical protein